MLPSRKRQCVINEIDLDRFMTEDFEPGSHHNRGGAGMFGVDFAEDGGAPGFRAKKSKSKIMPDPNKCQIFSLADMMIANEDL